MCGHAGAGDVVLMIGIMDGSYALIGYGVMIFGIFISSLSCIAGCMHCGGVRFRHALPVMVPWFVTWLVPWFIGLLGLFGAVRIFRDIGNGFSSIAIMPVDAGMVQGVIRLVNKQMSAAARGIMFGRIALLQNLLMQAGLLFTMIIICCSAFIVFEPLITKV